MMMSVSHNTVSAFNQANSAFHGEFHRKLATFNQQRLQPGFGSPSWQADLAMESKFRIMEGHFVEKQRAGVAALAAEAPRSADAFVEWFEGLRESGPGQGDALFPWLASTASMTDMRWFITQEIAGEAGFDDLVAMTQVKFPVQAKLELARNYWDEMGRGSAGGMHGPMLDKVAQELKLEPSIENTVWEALALANTMVALAANRRYAYHAVGALGVIEMTAPGRVSQINAGLKRLGVSAEARSYFQLHAGLDIKHSAAWNREILHSLVLANPLAARPIAEGALLRLTCGARCFERYRLELEV
ncbi:MAG: iron-containing redox enzyme family protein [Gammaproteobacteria bacterium]